MSEPQAGAFVEALAALRSAGAARLDPARFRYLEALARRLEGQAEPVRRLLSGKLQAALDDYAQRFAQAQQAAQPRPARRIAVERHQAAACLPLAQLNAYIRAASQQARANSSPGEGAEPDELASVRRFRRTWSRRRALEQVEQAAARKPANAGPLNSHVLVLQSLALMQELSPDYLRRFVLHVESLQWLEAAREALPQKTKPQRRARQKKPAP